MLHPTKNRLDYGAQLVPPQGYQLHYAIGTTYSLDLEALMLIPVAMFYSQDLDIKADSIRYDMLDALTKAADRITIFCQKGKIKVPSSYHHLIAYWEKGICEIAMKNHISSFHPKVWIIRFEASNKPACYRLVVLSRNLTFTRDWDIAFSSEGFVGNQTVERTSPLIHFIQSMATMGKRRLPKKFLSDLEKVDFDVPESFKLINFFPIGVPNTSSNIIYPNPLQSKKWDELLIISPFIDNSTITSLIALTRKKPTLLSRKDELDGIDSEIIKKVNCFEFSQFIIDAENNEFLSEDNQLQTQQQNLHAKLFIGLKDGFSHWFLGSANCSSPAFEPRNIEFLIGIQGNGPGQKPRDIIKMLTESQKGEIPVFNPYHPENRTSQEERKEFDLNLRKLIYDLSMVGITGTANPREEAATYDLVINIDAKKLKIASDFSVRLKPLPEKNKLPVLLAPGLVNCIEEFGGYTETALSPFIQWEIWHNNQIIKQFLVLMQIDLPCNRLNRIFTSIINSSDKFLKYLTFLLTGEETEFVQNSNGIIEKTGTGFPENWNEIFRGVPFFEKLLVAASRYPDRLISIEHLIERIRKEQEVNIEHIITKEFENLWAVFKGYMEVNKNER